MAQPILLPPVAPPASVSAGQAAPRPAPPSQPPTSSSGPAAAARSARLVAVVTADRPYYDSQQVGDVQFPVGAPPRVIELPAFMHCPQWVVVNGERIETAWEGEGLRFQVEEVHRRLAEGATESPVMPLDETLLIAGILDDIRAQIGVVYPGE